MGTPVNQHTSLQADGFHLTGFNAARPFSSFLPGIAGEYGKPMWVFDANRGWCVSSFGVRDRNSAMLEFQPANKVYALTPLHGCRARWRLLPRFFTPIRPCLFSSSRWSRPINPKCSGSTVAFCLHSDGRRIRTGGHRPRPGFWL